MTKTLAMFPGQGSQYVGMGKTLLENFSYVKEVFEEAEDALKVNVRKLCLEGPEEELKLTANTQPTILTCSVATWTILKSETGFNPDLYAGHSLGEYSALVASGKLKFSDAVKLVRTRGEQMQIAVPKGKGAMSAVLSFDVSALEELCKKATSELLVKGLDPLASSVEIANYNSPKQLIISGGAEAVSTVSEMLAEQKAKVVSLPVSAPFHSKLMKPARDAMQPLLEATSLTKNDSKVIANISGKIEEDYSTKLLIEQIDGPVLWTQTISCAIENECTKFVEVGPGKVLFGLARREVPKGSTLICTDDILKAIEDLK